MKNRAYFLIAPVLILGLLGCESRIFKAEREMWHAQKLARVITNSPKETPPYQFQKARDAFNAIIKKYPDSLFAIQSQFSIGHLYLAKGEYDKSRDEYKKLTLDCAEKSNLCAEAYSAIGNSYEVEGKWDMALANYRKIMQSFPLSSKSIDLPIYCIRHYRRAQDEKGVQVAVDEAVAHFQALSGRPGAEKAGYVIQGLVVRAYVEGAQWQNALNYLDKIAVAYPGEHPEQAVWLKALIYGNKLNDKPKAKEELRRIVRDYPQSKLAKPAETLLKKL